MSSQRIIIVIDNDEIIAYRDRAKPEQGDIYRVTGLWVTNSKGDILMAQRAFSKSHDPGKWGPAAAGTVDEGETYDDNVVKEAEEEIGLVGIKPAKGPKRRVSGQYDYFVQWYTLSVDKAAEDFVIRKEEVEQVRWFTRPELERAIAEHPDQYLPNLHWILGEL